MTLILLVLGAITVGYALALAYWAALTLVRPLLDWISTRLQPAKVQVNPANTVEQRFEASALEQFHSAVVCEPMPSLAKMHWAASLPVLRMRASQVGEFKSPAVDYRTRLGYHNMLIFLPYSGRPLSASGITARELDTFRAVASRKVQIAVTTSTAHREALGWTERSASERQRLALQAPPAFARREFPTSRALRVRWATSQQVQPFGTAVLCEGDRI
jgi:hypothetical protein